MKTILTIALAASTSLCAANSTYRDAGTWTGNNAFSSAPTPYCPCDRNPNVPDCPETFDTEDFIGEACYDEYIPESSGGWAHAKVYESL